MKFQKIISKALSVKNKYSKVEKQKYGKSWSKEDLVHGFVGDVGDLSKLIQAKNGLRDIQDVDKKLKHELADCLWSVITIADAYNVDLEKSFVETMYELEDKLNSTNE